ncbi:hypothetical protein [Bacillus sp. REN10]|uniref:hypothetical protein n=1 Tax=Bacillus sp. REN10 TaxID=2782541 RepID=UPI00193C2E90|nr:hypothetical protein [Bacillus sp. REN10]
MKKQLFSFLLVMSVVFMLAACNSNKDEDLLFQGEGESWRTEVYIGQTTEYSEKRITPSIYLKFKGSNPKVVEHLRYKVETKQGGLSGGEYTLNERGEVAPDAEEINKVVTSKTKELTITVDWSEKGKEKSEIIILEKR